MNSSNSIECPKCGEEIDVNEVLYNQLEKQLKTDFQDKLNEERSKLKDQKESIAKQLENLELLKESIEDHIRKGVKEKLGKEKSELRIKLKAEITEEQADYLKELQQELNEKSDKVKELNKAQAEIERLKREKDEAETNANLKAEKKITEKLKSEREKIERQESDKSELRLKEKQKVIDDLQTQLKNAEQKARQGSMQLQGEVQELAIEEWLEQKFPQDIIDEIGKGIRGGDCLQRVGANIGSEQGSIYYESKRAKDFQPKWVEKFKNDMKEKGAQIGVLVSEARPMGWDRLGQIDEIWVCTFEEFKALCFVLRETVTKVNRAFITQENKGDKMVILYDYLTGDEFRLTVQGIIDGFSKIKDGITRERRAMEKLWKEREKQAESVILNTASMVGSLQGIAGADVLKVTGLELPGTEDSSLEEGED